MRKPLAFVSILLGLYFVLKIFNIAHMPYHRLNPLLFIFVAPFFVAGWYLLSHDGNKINQAPRKFDPVQPHTDPFVQANPVSPVFEETAAARQRTERYEPPAQEYPSGWPQATSPIPTGPYVPPFDETVLRRKRTDITQARPPRLSGRIREIRRWEDEGMFFGNKKSLGFYLDYDRTSEDFGDLLVRLRTRYFKTLKLEDGDRLEIALKWKRQLGYVAGIKNLNSGQRVIPTSVSFKAGFLEAVEDGTEKGAMG